MPLQATASPQLHWTRRQQSLVQLQWQQACSVSCLTLSCVACLQALSNQLKEQGIEMVLPAMADSRLLVMLQQALEEAGVPCAAPNSAVLTNAQHKAR